MMARGTGILCPVQLPRCARRYRLGLAGVFGNAKSHGLGGLSFDGPGGNIDLAQATYTRESPSGSVRWTVTRPRRNWP